MKERIQQFLQEENKSSSQLAEEIGVQPSGISHIISGRNNPSLDFVIKMLTRYNHLSPDWLLFGKGTMFKNQRTPELFDNELFNTNSMTSHNSPGKVENSYTENKSARNNLNSDDISIPNVQGTTEKIVCFFKNGSFREYYPGK